jgi:amidophosphoribosyltransferase
MTSIHSVTSDEYPDPTNNPINSDENQPDKPEEACGVLASTHQEKTLLN